MKRVVISSLLVFVLFFSLSFASAFWPFDWIIKRIITGNAVITPADNTFFRGTGGCVDGDFGIYSLRQGYVSVKVDGKWRYYYDSCKDEKTLLENYCNVDKRDVFEINCPKGCVNSSSGGFCNSITKCEESDGGSNAYVGGDVKGISHIPALKRTSLIVGGKDYCGKVDYRNGTIINYLVEYYCQNTENPSANPTFASTRTIKCPKGCEKDLFGQGYCLPDAQHTCTDTDGGDNPLVPGVVKGYNSQSDSIKSYYDGCTDEETLLEYICKSSGPGKVEFICNGKCVKKDKSGYCPDGLAVASSCIDSDSNDKYPTGLNFEKNGKASLGNNPKAKGYQEVKDSCSGNQVLESYCDAGVIKQQAFTCPTICKGGECEPKKILFYSLRSDYKIKEEEISSYDAFVTYSKNFNNCVYLMDESGKSIQKSLDNIFCESERIEKPVEVKVSLSNLKFKFGNKYKLCSAEGSETICSDLTVFQGSFGLSIPPVVVFAEKKFPNAKCEELIPEHNNLNEKRINFILTGYNYSSTNEFLLVVNDAINSHVGFLKREPFSSQRNDFNFWYVDTIGVVEDMMMDRQGVLIGKDEKGLIEVCLKKLGNIGSSGELIGSPRLFAFSVVNKGVGGSAANTLGMNGAQIHIPELGKPYMYASIMQPAPSYDESRWKKILYVDKVGSFTHEAAHALTFPSAAVKGGMPSEWRILFDEYSPIPETFISPAPYRYDNCFAGSLEACNSPQENKVFGDLIGNGCGKEGVFDCCTNDTLQISMGARSCSSCPTCHEDPLYGLEVACFEGCMYNKGDYRGTFRNVMMDGTASGFGLSNERILKKDLEILLSL